ncbi:PDR/VanB family oxidoreductase (plasmid) [Rhodococcus sp. USK10]|uniref:PDR/VanB family oxidoreductase n=1 Tax=Rhodococcus sp. USK10 TaxID=2789739 RepID=UPI001C5F1568|nr:PDR/VanB family oxidoreductase [Rhodococcus sp. USK10]QYA99783.1 PDR/VanB family oxidoreductase [Rhodococcus sp. USK10]
MTIENDRTLAAPTGELTLTLVVDSCTAAADDVVELVLAAPDGDRLPSWDPGSHLDVLLESGLVRQYSLSGSPATPDCYRLGILRDSNSRGGSAEVHDTLRKGSTVTIRGPRNNFPLVPAPRYVFIAGGIGITPILPMLEAATISGAEWALHYGGRSSSSMAFVDELSAYGDRVTIYPQDTDGPIPLDEILGSLDGALVYCCGPEGLLAAVESVSELKGHPRASLHVERFVPKEIEAGPAAGFEVELARSGCTLHVPEDKSIVEVAREIDVLVFTSCEEGMCGSCETRVLEGEPEHLDSYKSPEEHEAEGTMAICVSRAMSAKLVLDL